MHALQHISRKLHVTPVCLSRRVGAATLGLLILTALTTSMPCRAADAVSPETAPLPTDVAAALSKQGLVAIDKVVIVHASGPPTIWTTRPVDYDHPMPVDPVQLLEGVYDQQDAYKAPFYFLNGKGCIKCGKQCCF
jgi:hypothetical protein